MDNKALHKQRLYGSWSAPSCRVWDRQRDRHRNPYQIVRQLKV
ncbi:hypothetical protein [Microseira wollei]|nr:hypothetical protein [Microseira wollei]